MSCYSYSMLCILFYVVSAISIDKSLREDKMYLLIEEDIFTISLFEDPITQRLISSMPLKTKLIEKEQTKIRMSLSVHIDVDALYSTKNYATFGNKGDVILYKGKEIIILNESTTFVDDDRRNYIKIGRSDDAETLLNRIEANKIIPLWNTLNYENHKGKVKPYAKYSSIMNYFTWKIFTFFCFLLI